MKFKLSILSLGFALCVFSAQALAHDFWAMAVTPKVNQKLTAVIGYGHDFPVGEALKDEDMNVRFTPPKVYGEDGEIALEKGSTNSEFVSQDDLKQGRYVVTTQTNGLFFTRSVEGFVAKPKNEVKGAKSCVYMVRFGKEAINVGRAKDTGLAAKAVGQELEIVPQADPSFIKVGKPFPVKVLFKGQPLGRAEVSAYVAGIVEHNPALFFQARTNPEGIVNIIPLKEGDWLAKVTVEEPYAKKKVCDNTNYTASYTFKVIK
ncbi:MAG: DUF4198 domain-containing protein [Deltaproteobacteria bacterium]|jgi:uncharacterized GH25 family protein|nr:DUF4198 domain-containing protein [Deltaproteobacteria bacterium]